MDKNVCEYELQFLNFDVESARDYSGKCSKDFVQLPDGSTLCGYFSGKSIEKNNRFSHQLIYFFFFHCQRHTVSPHLETELECFTSLVMTNRREEVSKYD